MKSIVENLKKCLTRLAKPLAIIPRVQGAFWIFVFVTIIIGQTSILLPLLVSIGHQNMTFYEVLTDRLLAGSFYTFSISLIASRITPFLIEYLDKKEIHFRHIKVIASLFAFVLLLLPMACLLARRINPPLPATSSGPVDQTQLLFYIISILACLYLFCVSCLDYDYESYADLDQKDMVRLRSNAASKSEDSQGNTL